MKNVPASDQPMLGRLETTVRAELILAEAGQREPAADGAAAEQIPDPDADDPASSAVSARVRT